MQEPPVLKGSGLKPLDETKSTDGVVVIFGKNLEERVLTKDEEDSDTANSVEQKDKLKPEGDDLDTLKEVKYDAITGEEDEETIFQGDFKLFTWDIATSNWIERGRGQLKLNDYLDTANKRSRLIMRVSGTLKIVLNVAIKSTFKILANTRSSIRFTDSQTVWAATGSNAQQLRELIDERLEQVTEDCLDSKKRSMPDDDVPSKKTKSEDLKASNGDEVSATENSATENSPADNSASENSPADNLATEDSPTKNSATEKSSADNSARQNSPTESSPTKNLPTENSPTQNSPEPKDED